MTRRVLLSWSSGKDCAWALHVLGQIGDVEVAGLLTTFNEQADRVVMHAVRHELVQAQAGRIGLPLWPVMLPAPCSNAVYETHMAAVMDQAAAAGITHVAFGDLLLEDVRAYREHQFADSVLAPLFPVWHTPTGTLARQMVDAGLQAIVTCVDTSQLDARFAGRTFDHAFLDDLPEDVDPCGENGEFHTCVLDAPMFSEPIAAQVGEIIQRDGFTFADLVPIQGAGLQFA